MTIAGKNEIYHRENLVGPFLVHKILGPRPPSLPPSPPLLIPPCQGARSFDRFLCRTCTGTASPSVTGTATAVPTYTPTQAAFPAAAYAARARACLLVIPRLGCGDLVLDARCSLLSGGGTYAYHWDILRTDRTDPGATDAALRQELKGQTADVFYLTTKTVCDRQSAPFGNEMPCCSLPLAEGFWKQSFAMTQGQCTLSRVAVGGTIEHPHRRGGECR